MARNERSAGVLVFRNDGKSAGKRRFLLLNYGRYWEYPKGHVEPGEDDRTAALRELKEETGIDDVQLLPDFQHEITYFFRVRDKGLIRKVVVFFLAETTATSVKISHEHEGAEFLPYEQAIERLKYPTSKEVLRLANQFLDSAK